MVFNYELLGVKKQKVDLGITTSITLIQRLQLRSIRGGTVILEHKQGALYRAAFDWGAYDSI